MTRSRAIQGRSLSRVLRVMLCVGIVLPAIAAAASKASAAFPGGNGRIAYAESPAESASSEIFTISPTGGDPQQLTQTLSVEDDPSWSADGQRITFIAVRNNGGSGVLIMDSDGANLIEVASSTTRASPSFSPSGRRIVYATGRAISSVRTDGTGRRRVIQGDRRGVTLSSPEYAPSAKRIVFAGTPHGRHRSGIWTIRPNGSSLRRLTDPERTNRDLADDAPSYSPDGRLVAFVRRPASRGGSQILLVGAGGSHERLVPGTFGYDFPAFAPAGDRLVMAAQPVAANCSDLYTITVSGTESQRVTANCETPGSPIGEGVAFSPSWQPVFP